MVTEGTVIETPDFLIYSNPSLSQLIGLTKKHDLRGLIIGDDLFVADANIAIHSNIDDELAHIGGERKKCYFYDPTSKDIGRLS